VRSVTRDSTAPRSGPGRRIRGGQGIQRRRDVRLIDWNVSARSQSLFVKRMEEERERSVMLALDTSASLDFGSVSRTSSTSWLRFGSSCSAVLRQDRVSLALLRDRVYQYIEPAKAQSRCTPRA